MRTYEKDNIINIGKRYSKSIWGAFILAFLILPGVGWCEEQSVVLEPTTILWTEEFEHGTPNAFVSTWNQDYDSYDNVTYTALIYSYTDSFAYVSMTANSRTNSSGIIKSEPIVCDTAVFDTLQTRIVDIMGQTLTAWNIYLEVDRGLENPILAYLQTGTIGASGVFRYDIHTELTKALGDPGIETFRICMETKLHTESATNGFLLLDYFRIYETPKYQSNSYLENNSRKSYEDLWSEDFSEGIPGEPVEKWWDERDEINELDTQDRTKWEIMDAAVYYERSGARLRMLPSHHEIPDRDKGFKVRAPGIYWDPNEYNFVRVSISHLQPDTKCNIFAYEVDEAVNKRRRVHIGRITEPGKYVFNVRQSSDWLWFNKRMLCLEFFIEGHLPETYYNDKYYSINYIAISKEVLPTVLNETVQTYCTPNPFYPLRAQIARIHFVPSDQNLQYEIVIYNLKGQLIRHLDHECEWDGRNSSGVLCEGGVYIYQMKMSGKIRTGQIVLIK